MLHLSLHAAPQVHLIDCLYFLGMREDLLSIVFILVVSWENWQRQDKIQSFFGGRGWVSRFGGEIAVPNDDSCGVDHFHHHAMTLKLIVNQQTLVLLCAGSPQHKHKIKAFQYRHRKPPIFNIVGEIFQLPPSDQEPMTKADLPLQILSVWHGLQISLWKQLFICARNRGERFQKKCRREILRQLNKAVMEFCDALLGGALSVPNNCNRKSLCFFQIAKRCYKNNSVAFRIVFRIFVRVFQTVFRVKLKSFREQFRSADVPP